MNTRKTSKTAIGRCKEIAGQNLDEIWNEAEDRVLFIYLFHLFTQGKPKQLTLVFIGALHTFHIVINMYVQFKHNTIQSNLRT